RQGREEILLRRGVRGRSLLSIKGPKRLVVLVWLGPFFSLWRRALQCDLGPNPVETLQHTTGDWTLLFLVFTLAVPPLRKVLNLPALIRFRRMLGLFA